MFDCIHHVLARRHHGWHWYPFAGRVIGLALILLVCQPGVGQAMPLQDEQAPRITLVVKDSTLGYVVRTIAAQAKMGIAFDRKNAVFSRRVNVDLQGVPLPDALASVLKGTELRVSKSPNGETLIIQAVKDSSTSGEGAKNATGRVRGQITDSVSRKGLSGATVTIVGTKWSTVSDTRGMFQLPGVTRGSYRLNVRLLGYTTKSMSLDVDSAETWVVVPLITAATALTEVVTTATGQQRRVEVGNDITVIKADSVVRTMPVSNMSELLSTRVPGLYAVPTSGEPGAPTRIRIRGTSSINAGNDPIIIVDGVRAYGEQMRILNDRTELRPTSPIDQIDVNSVETIEVLKGPSAVAIYGSDAANGVIVITTKRGKEGPPQWSVSSSFGTTSMPGAWPVNYYRWGHNRADVLQLLQCTLVNETRGTCVPDSVVSYQILNDRETTIFGTGLRQQYNADLRGGNRGLTYALSGTIQKEVGLVKIANADRRLLEASGKLVPFWQRRPQQNEVQSGTLNVGLAVGQRHNVSFTTNLHHGVNTGTPLRKAIAVSQSLGPSMGRDATGVLEQIPDFRQRESSTILRNRNSLSLRSNLPWRVSTEVISGIDVSWPTTRAFLAPGDCFVLTASCDNTGKLSETHGPTTVTSLDIRASLPVDGNRLLSFRNTAGLNYARSIVENGSLLAMGLPLGTMSPRDASYTYVDQQKTDRVTAGVYIETVVGLANRVYLPLSLRKDAGSALGSNVAPLFPKLSFSYLASDEPWFRAIPTLGRLSTLRLRVGYGQAGKQPQVSNRLRTYDRQSAMWDGSSELYLSLYGIGNTQLKPERSKEFEGGFDTDFWDNRIALGATWYRKYTTDLLVSGSLPPSVNEGSPQWFNLGDVHNTGFESTIGATVIDARQLNWHLDFMLSRNRNVLVRMRSNNIASAAITRTQNVVGYPLNGYWAKQLIGYSDFDQDGIIAADEVLLSDSIGYVGSPDPKVALSIGHNITVLKRLSFNARFKYDHALTQWNSLYSNGNNTKIRPMNDPSTPLSVQAYALWSDLAKLQTVSVLRFSELSISYIFPHSVTRRLIREKTLQAFVQGTNLGMWTNYRGKDPSVNGSASGEQIIDNGVLPKNRVWQIKFTIN